MAYRITEEKGETKVEINAKRLKDAFLDAARALNEIRYTIKKTKDTDKVEFAIDAKGINELMALWLTNLIQKTTSEKLVPSGFEILSVQEIQPDHFLLTGRAHGATYDPALHKQKKEIKEVVSSQVKCTTGEKVSCTYTLST